MSLLDLAILYVLLGVASAVAIYRAERKSQRERSPSQRFHALGLALLAVPLWPLWAPIALGRHASTPPPWPQASSPAPQGSGIASPSPRTGDSGGVFGPAHMAVRIEEALHECVRASAGTPIEPLMPPEAAARISTEVARAATRHAEIDALIRREGFDIDSAERRLAALEAAHAASRVLATARIHLDNVRRLVALRDRDAAALEELLDLVHALRTQLHLARYAESELNAHASVSEGATFAGTSGIVSEVWARVEGLSAVLVPAEFFLPNSQRGTSSTA
ncbi:hypothetical protein [Chondromyces crocatus]|uniref:Uncharacterized protein n=1 Tax=Chondromyces crocatus TaxID=52 RepID=A0A0K1EL24_CHOCO|nr:hypothetical protein [Chondromyces crocatus]AKT41559.1 uncharacterized protein CMC5_057660 [Chondromyces crocatus]